MWKPPRKNRTLTKTEQNLIDLEVQRYAQHTGRQTWFDRLKKRFGGVGEIIGVMADVIAGTRRKHVTPSDRDVIDALRLLEQSGYDIDTPVESRIVQPPPIVRPVSPPGFRVDAWPPEHTIPIEGHDYFPGQPHSIDTRVVSSPLARPDRDHPFENEIETPHSSNVFSFTYDVHNGILYVTYKATGKPISHRQQINQCSGDEYKMGVRSHVRGAMYAYGGKGRPVPRHVYESLLRTSSPGGTIWKYLRQCGTMHGHQYPYRLIQGEIRGAGHYVPRKATARGFRVRTLPSVGQVGTIGGRQSNLGERLFG